LIFHLTNVEHFSYHMQILTCIWFPNNSLESVQLIFHSNAAAYLLYDRCKGCTLTCIVQEYGF